MPEPVVTDAFQYQGNISFDPHMPDSLFPVAGFAATYPYVFCFEDLATEGTVFSASGHRKYTKHYYVKVAERVSPATACRCPGVPRPYAKFNAYRNRLWETKQDEQALAVEISATLVDKKEFSWWEITVEFSTQMPDGGPVSHLEMRMPDEVLGFQNEPWNLPVKIVFDTEDYQESPDGDLDGKPYRNAAGTPFIPAHATPRTYRVTTIIRNEKWEDFGKNQDTYDNVVNIDTFTVAGKTHEAGYVFCPPPRAEEMYLGRTHYVRATYRLKIKKRVRLGDGTFSPGWQPKILNAGLYQKQSFFAGNPDETVPIVINGRQANQPQLLKLDGTVQKERFAAPVGGAAWPRPDMVGQLKPTYCDFREFEKVALTPLLRGKS